MARHDMAAKDGLMANTNAVGNMVASSVHNNTTHNTTQNAIHSTTNNTNTNTNTHGYTTSLDQEKNPIIDPLIMKTSNRGSNNYNDYDDDDKDDLIERIQSKTRSTSCSKDIDLKQKYHGEKFNKKNVDSKTSILPISTIIENENGYCELPERFYFGQYSQPVPPDRVEC
jgi:hypothetical protein